MYVDQPARRGTEERGQQQSNGECGEDPRGRDAELRGHRVREDRRQVVGGAPGEGLRDPEGNHHMNRLVQRAACFTASAMLLAADSIASRGSPSTITRSTGSVPEGRSSTRPLPLNACSAALLACWIDGCDFQSKPRGTATLSSTCGYITSSAVSSASERPDSRIASSTCSAETMPSPVVCLSRQMTCPEFSPPSCQPFSRKSSST